MIKQLKHRKYLLELVFFATLTAVLHYLALVNFLYWNVSWFDILMHFLGGVTMGFLALFVFFTSNYLPGFAKFKYNKLVVFYIVISFTMVIGLGWELWEIFYDMTDIMMDKADSILDLIMDFIGALVVVGFDFKQRKSDFITKQ
jgi:hypothetical protein